MPPPNTNDYQQLRQCAEALSKAPEDPQVLEQMGSLLAQMGQPGDAISCFWRSAIFFRRDGHDIQAARSCNKILELNSSHEGALEMLNSLFPGEFTKTLLDQRKPADEHQNEKSIEIPIGDEDLILEDTREIPTPPGVDSIKVKVAIPAPNTSPEVEPPRSLHPGIMKPLSLRDIPPPKGSAQASSATALSKDDGASKKTPAFLDNATKAPIKAPAAKASGASSPTMPPLAKEATKPPTRGKRQRRLAVTQPVPPELLVRSPKGTTRGKKLKIESSSSSSRAALDTTERCCPPQMEADPLALTTPLSIEGLPTMAVTPSIIPSYYHDQGTVRQCGKNEYIFREKDASKELYLIEAGAVEVTKKARGQRRRKLATLEAGDCFGELALLGDGIRHTTAKTTMPGTLRVFQHDQIRALMKQDPDFNGALRRIYRHRLQTFLLKISSIFSGLPKKEAITFIRRCKPLGLKAGQVVVEEGTPATGFYIVLLGQLEVSVKPKKGGPVKMLGQLSDGEFFGEISLVYDQPTTATIKTCGFSQLLQMSAGEFHRFVNSNHAFMKIIETEAKRREKSNRAILRGAAKYDEKKGVVYLKGE